MAHRKWIGIFVRVGISFFLLGFLFWKTDLSRFSEILKSTDLPLFLTTLFSYIGVQIFFSFRWQLLLKVLHLIIPLKNLFKTYLIGLFFNNFLPTAIGGDLARGLDLYRYTKKAKEAAISVIMERLTGFTAQMIIALMALALIYSSLPDPLIAWLIMGTFIIYLLSLLLLFSPTVFILIHRLLQKLNLQNIGEKLLQVPEAISLYKSSPKVLAQTVLLSLALQGFTIFLYYVLSVSMHLSIPLTYFFLFLPIINIVSMLPSLGGLGVREGISVYLFQIVGVEPAHALGLSLAWFFIILLTSLLGGAIFAFQSANKPVSPPP